MNARLRGHQWWLGGVALTVLVLIWGLCDVPDAGASSTGVGTPTHPQILTCYEEATQFTGSLPPVGRHDIGFGAGYFPKARGLATMNPPNSGRAAHLTGYKLPPVVFPGATVTMTIARGARSYVVQQNPWSPRQGSVSVTYRACLHKPGFFPPELPVHRWSKAGLRSPRRAGQRAATDEPHRSVVLRWTVQSFVLTRQEPAAQDVGLTGSGVSSTPGGWDTHGDAAGPHDDLFLDVDRQRR